MSKGQKRKLAEAQALGKKGAHQGAARLLETSGLQREAVSLLESHGLIEEAAAILNKINRPNRAGVLFARNGKWREAIDCFLKAEMPLEAAKSAYAAEDYKLAGKLFLQIDRLREAAKCFMNLKMYQEAARIFEDLGDLKMAKELRMGYQSGETKASKLGESDRGRKDSMSSAFSRNVLLSLLDESERQVLWGRCEQKQFQPNQIVLNSGEAPEGIYFIQRGEVAQVERDTEELSELKTLTKGDQFGDLMIFSQAYDQNLVYVAKTQVEITYLSGVQLEQIMDKDGTIARKLYRSFLKNVYPAELKTRAGKQKLLAS